MNAFEAPAEAQTPAPIKRKLGAVERRRAKAKQAEKELQDEKVLSKIYRQWKQAKRDALLTGPFGREVRGIVSFLDTMTLSSAPALIRVVQDAAFLKRMSTDERFTLLNIIGKGITRCREKAGLPPFEDALSFAGEPDKAFHQIKTAMELDGK